MAGCVLGGRVVQTAVYSNKSFKVKQVKNDMVMVVFQMLKGTRRWPQGSICREVRSLLHSVLVC
jgi:hypothetical protein